MQDCSHHHDCETAHTVDLENEKYNSRHIESLQSIFDRAEWEEVPAKSECKEGETNYFVLVPKQKEIRSLFEDLLTLKI